MQAAAVHDAHVSRSSLRQAVTKRLLGVITHAQQVKLLVGTGLQASSSPAAQQHAESHFSCITNIGYKEEKRRASSHATFQDT